MHRILIMLALLAGPAVGDVNEDRVYADSYARYTAWSHACELLMRDAPEKGGCIGLLAPEVVFERMDFGLRGYYDGGKNVYVSRALRPGVDRMSTMIHEMIHYVHVQRDGLEVPTPFGDGIRMLCLSEYDAFRLTDIWLARNGHDDMVRGPTWWKAYWHCQPYYDPEFDIWEWFKAGIKRIGG